VPHVANINGAFVIAPIGDGNVYEYVIPDFAPICVFNDIALYLISSRIELDIVDDVTYHMLVILTFDELLL